MCLVPSGGRSLNGTKYEGSVNVKVVANISRFNRESGKSRKNVSIRDPPKESFAVPQEGLRQNDRLLADLQDRSPGTLGHSCRNPNNNAIFLILCPPLPAQTFPDDLDREVPFLGSVPFLNNLKIVLRRVSRATQTALLAPFHPE